MKLKIFTFRFSDTFRGFDDKVMQDFISDKEVIEYSEHFFINEKTPYLTIIISYRDINQDEKSRYTSRQDPRKELDESEKKLYDTLRNWRAAKAKQEGIPPYIIANNKQLAKMIRINAKTFSDLVKIDGIGEAKVEQYGKEILDIFSQHSKETVNDSPLK